MRDSGVLLVGIDCVGVALAHQHNNIGIFGLANTQSTFLESGRDHRLDRP
jgi:hypothetical protein